MPEGNHDFDEVPRYAGLRDYLRVFREHRLLIFMCTVLLGGAAFAFSASERNTYEATAKLNPRPQAQDFILAGTESGPPQSPEEQQSELATLATRGSIADRTRKGLASNLSTNEIQSKVGVGVEVKTGLVTITARDESASFAADLANAYARQVEAVANQEERGRVTEALKFARRQRNAAKRGELIGESTPSVVQQRFNELQALKNIVKSTELVATAGVPESPVSPKPARNTILGALAGLLLGIVLAFLRDSLDGRLKAPREIEDELGLPRLGQFSEEAFGRGVGIRNGIRAFAPVDLEAARIIRSNIELIGGDNPVRSLVVTSALPDEGKSTAAIALASVSAMAGKLTLLIECDLRQPVFADRLDLAEAPGLSDVLLGRAKPREVVQIVELGSGSNGGGAENGEAGVARLVCVTAGTPVPNPPELLASERFRKMLSEVTAAYEAVILDTGPLLSVVDARELLPLVDGIVLCARSYQTTRDQARAAREALEHVEADVAGVVVTGVRRRDDDYYGYYYRYAEPGRGAVGGSPS
ncbi:MAG: polysaccharide biosynthesis tyrosine autokinase [Solirubrobacterales bacterium]